MKANVCENSTCHQVNKTKTRIVKLLLLAFIQDSRDGRFMVRFCNIFEENLESIAPMIFY